MYGFKLGGYLKIITVTPNTAIDFVIVVKDLSNSENIVAEHSKQFAAGKAVNVAKAVASLSYPVHVMGFVGAQSLGVFQSIQGDLMHTDFTVVAGLTRTNLTIADAQYAHETHIRTQGYAVSALHCTQLLEALANVIEKHDLVILSGSLPQGASEQLYAKMIVLCHDHDACVFLDSSGLGLSEGVVAKPFLIKPNHREFETLMGRTLSDEFAIINAAREMIALGIRWVVVSRGAQGAIAVAANAIYVANFDGNAQPLSYVGCGDAMVAGLAVAKFRGGSLLQAIQLGMACAVANLYTLEPGVLDKTRVAKMSKDIFIRSIE